MLMILLILIYKIIQYNIYCSSEIVNKFLNYFCSDNAIIDPKTFIWTENFRLNWKNIKDEYINYTKSYNIPYHHEINSIVANCDIDNGWKTLYLRAFDVDTNLSKLFPITMKLINMCPCTLAFFSVLQPGAKLEPHIGIYKGVIRYHLGLIIPDDKEQCFLNINGTKLHWHEGDDLMFDDMFLHHVENNTNQIRVVLFLDIKRDFHNIFINMINTLFIKIVKTNDALKDTINNANNFTDKYLTMVQ